MDVFDQVRKALQSGNVEAGFDLAIQRFRKERSYPMIFEARLMKARHRLGMPLIQTGPWTGLSPEVQTAYEQATVEAAREVGSLFLDDGGDRPGLAILSGARRKGRGTESDQQV